MAIQQFYNTSHVTHSYSTASHTVKNGVIVKHLISLYARKPFWCTLTYIVATLTDMTISFTNQLLCVMVTMYVVYS